ncbi:MAG: 4Fe-4S dicluster domain-containing protein [Planctomycetes bacterium]|nr:4Fe-4S dicluster domain-containing protein [Planctomycetota bacterium]
MAKLSGGLDFPQGQPLRLPPPPEQLAAYPLQMYCPDRPEVITSQTVRRGQFLIEPLRHSDACYVSPITGTVRSVTPVDEDGGGGYRVLIEPPSGTVVTSLEVAPPRGRKLENWFAAMRQVGPWSDLDGGVGLIKQLDAARNRPVDRLICVGLDAFPPYPDRSSLLMSFPDDAVLGTLILADMLNVKQVVMLAGRVPAMLGRLRSSCKKYRLRLMVEPNRYPAAHPTTIAYTTRTARGAGPRFLPHGHNPVEQGLMMITPWTAIRVGRWFTLRRFDLVRPIFLARPDQAQPITGHFVMPGAPLASIAPELGEAHVMRERRVLRGDPMTGRPLGEPGVVPADHTLLTLLPAMTPREIRPCINCGLCLDVCPTQLDPVRMLKAAQKRRDDAWLWDQLPWCIDCGLCSYICPSAIPLAQTFAGVQQQVETSE